MTINIPKIISPTGVTVVLDGKPKMVRREAPEYAQLIELLNKVEKPAQSDLDKIEALLDRPSAIQRYTEGAVEADGNGVTFEGEPVHGTIVSRIISAIQDQRDPKPLMRFLEKLKQNPSFRAVTGAYDWLEACGFPISEEGNFLAWKIVRDDYRDCPTGRFDNTPGRVVSMPRNQCDEDPNQTCSSGLHFCSTGYLSSFGPADQRVVMVEIEPQDLVAFPRDYNLSKGRCCRYRVVMEIPKDEAREYFETSRSTFTPQPEPDPEREHSNEVFERLITLIDDQFDKEHIQAGDRFAEDLSISGIDLSMLMLAVEDEFEIEITDAQAEEIKTVGQLHKLILAPEKSEVDKVLEHMSGLLGVEIDPDEEVDQTLDWDEYAKIEQYLDENFGDYTSPGYGSLTDETFRDLAQLAVQAKADS